MIKQIAFWGSIALVPLVVLPYADATIGRLPTTLILTTICLVGAVLGSYYHERKAQRRRASN